MTLKIEDSYDIKLILVDDGSKDNSAKVIEKFCELDKNVSGIYFTRNFGHQNAVFAGLKEFDADLYLVLDSDLQHNPEIIELMIDNLIKTNSEIVQMKKKYVNHDTFFKRFMSKYFYLFFSKITNINIEPGSSDFYLITHKVKNELINTKLSYNFIRGFLHWTGYS